MAVALPAAFLATGFVQRGMHLLRRWLDGAPLALAWTVVGGVAIVLAAAVFLIHRRGWAARWRGRWRDWWRETRELLAFVHRRGWRILGLNVLLAGVQWSARLSILTALLAGLGVAVAPLRLAVQQWLCFTSMTLVPTPGAVGGAEAAFLVIFRGEIPAEMVPLAMTAWRVITFYALNILALALLMLPVWRARDAGAAACPAGVGCPGSPPAA
jgi:uncharacterized membrane protein YbhN (UPF0104 family)